MEAEFEGTWEYVRDGWKFFPKEVGLPPRIIQLHLWRQPVRDPKFKGFVNLAVSVYRNEPVKFLERRFCLLNDEDWFASLFLPETKQIAAEMELRAYKEAHAFASRKFNIARRELQELTSVMSVLGDALMEGTPVSEEERSSGFRKHPTMPGMYVSTRLFKDVVAEVHGNTSDDGKEEV